MTPTIKHGNQKHRLNIDLDDPIKIKIKKKSIITTNLFMEYFF